MFNDFWSGCDDKPAAFVDRLDQAEPYLNEQLTACGEFWQLDANTRKMLSLPPRSNSRRKENGAGTPLRTEARLDRRVPGALWQVLCRDWFEFCYHQSSLEDACGCSGSSHARS